MALLEHRAGLCETMAEGEVRCLISIDAPQRVAGYIHSLATTNILQKDVLESHLIADMETAP